MSEMFQSMNVYLICALILALTGCRNHIPDRLVIDPDNIEVLEPLHLNYSTGITVDSISLSGNSSVVLTQQSPFGLTVDLDVRGGELYEARMYRMEHNPHVYLVADGDWEDYYYQASWPIDEREGWQQIGLRVEIPEHIKRSKIRFYAYNVSRTHCHVDSLFIKRTTAQSTNILPDYSFYPLLYDVINDYHVRFFKDIPFDSILNYSASVQLNKLYQKHGTSLDAFLSTFNVKSARLDPKGMMAGLHEMKQETHRHSVGFKWEPSMGRVSPSGYVRQMFLWRNDTAHVTINDLKYCKAIRLHSLERDYKSRLIKEFPLPGTAELIFSCKDLLPGIYRLELVGDSSSFQIPLILNDIKEAAVAIVAPYSTWHAYNDYGGKSFYRNNIDSSDVNFVSTRRPVSSINFDSTFLGHDIFVLRNIYQWFDRNFGANLYPDHWLEAHPEKFESCKTIVLAQHCEYFSAAMLQNLVRLTATRSLLSLGGNQIYWKVKWHEGFTTLECRKDGNFFEGTNTPGGLWRNKLTSEARILGVAFTETGYGTYAPYRVTNAGHWLYENSEVSMGDIFGEAGIDNRGLSGDEMDKEILGSPKGSEIIAKGTNTDNGGGEIVYVDRGNYATLSCGSIACGSGLGKDSVFTGIVRNFMDRFQ